MGRDVFELDTIEKRKDNEEDELWLEGCLCVVLSHDMKRLAQCDNRARKCLLYSKQCSSTVFGSVPKCT